ncbi:hypothetical protein HY625_03410, partial [Candidatus Uhrbacteria bacterium]|nr:hypothetical protein [Candidatus Uhrbacteria bacterium]
MATTRHHPTKTKAIAIFFAVFFIVGTGTVLLPRHAEAQLFVPTAVIKDLPADFIEGLDNTKEKVKEGLKKVWGNLIVNTFKRATLNYVQRLSSTVGKSLAEGGKGGKPGFDTRKLRTALNDARESAVGDIIDSVGNGLGMNLCTPPDLRLNLSLGLFNAVEPPKPSCTFSEMQKNWQSAIDDPNLLQRLNVALNPQNTEVGQALATIIDATKRQEQAQEDQRLDRTINKGFQGFEKGVSNAITYPAGWLDRQAYDVLSTDKPKVLPDGPVGNFFEDLVTIGSYNLVASFTNTALQKLLQNGLFPPAKPKDRLSRPGSPGGSGAASSGGAVEPATFVAVNFSQTGTETDLLSEMTTCPEVGRNIYNCVLEQNFADAIRQGMTVREAMDKGLLKSDWPFGYGGTGGGDELRYDLGYPYANMKKLRRARIIPVGWELAAETVRENEKGGVTLKTVVDCFD